MTTVYYFNSFVPPELIAACNCLPERLTSSFETGGCSQTEGMCPFTQSQLETLLSRAKTETFAAVFTTSCDQMRRAYDLYRARCKQRAFLLNVPSTNTPNALAYYRQELLRLREFLCTLSRKSFDQGQLLTMPNRHQPVNKQHLLRVAVIGETVSESIHTALADILEKSHISVELNATDDKLADHFPQINQTQMKQDPFGALASAYFQLPAVWKRPNDFFYRWLTSKIQTNKINGVIVFQYIFCDAWHSAAYEFRKRLEIPVLQVDLDADDHLSACAVSRIQAFSEMLA